MREDLKDLVEKNVLHFLISLGSFSLEAERHHVMSICVGKDCSHERNSIPTKPSLKQTPDPATLSEKCSLLPASWPKCHKRF